MKKKWALELGLLGVISLLIGCSPKDSSLGLESEISAKGRFVEEEVKVPLELQNNRYIDCLEYDDKMEILSYSKEENQYYNSIYDGVKWNTENINANNLKDKITIKGFTKNADNDKYFYGYDENKEYHILSENQGTPLLSSTNLNSLSLTNDVVRLDKVIILNNGSVLLSIQDKAVLFSKDGEVLHEFAQDYNDGTTRESAFVTDNAYVTVLNQKLVSYSLKDGEMQELNSELSVDIWSNIFSDKEGSVFIANMDGLYHINENSTIIEKVIDGTLNSMSLQSDFIRKFYKNSQNTYFSVMNGLVDGNVSIFKYTYNSDIPTVPQNTVIVYSLNDSTTLRQAAALMQRQNSNVRVEIRIAMGEEYEGLSEDIIRSLNAELLNGGGADILVLDGLPKEAYKEKGTLVNLNELFSEIQKESPLLSNITQNFIEQGDIYYLPARFNMPVIFGKKKAVEAFGLMSLSEAQDVVPVLATDNYGNLERLMLNIFYNQMFFNEGNGLSEDGLRNYLKNVKILGEKIQAKVEFTPSEMESLGVDNYVSEFGNKKNGPVAFVQEITQVGFENIGSIQDSILTFAALEKKQLELESIDGIFYPKLMVGINKNTNNMELAKEFLKVLYSPDIQNQDLSDGFGILEASVLNWENVERDTQMVISDYDGSTILSASWPTKEKRNKVIELIKSLTTPVDIDPNIMNIVTEYSKSYFDGSQELETVINLIMNKVALYNEE